jgi:2'-5' RNA ligase
MARPESNLRLFVAVYPPLEMALVLLERAARLDLPGHRLTPPEQVHMTLQFIGDTPAAELDATRESVARSAAGLRAFSLRSMKLITLPERGPARLVAAETDAPPTLLELQRRLAHRLADTTRSRSRHGFRPHITLCRFESPTRLNALHESLQVDAFDVSAICLMRSTLRPDGAQHHLVEAFDLVARD